MREGSVNVLTREVWKVRGKVHEGSHEGVVSCSDREASASCGVGEVGDVEY